MTIWATKATVKTSGDIIARLERENYRLRVAATALINSINTARSSIDAAVVSLRAFNILSDVLKEPDSDARREGR